MQRSSSTKSRRRVAALGLIVVALFAGVAVAATQEHKHVVKTKAIPELGFRVLTNTKNHTLYALSAEKNGKFICVKACLGSWSPLSIPARTKPLGPVKLGTIARPDGGLQVTYKGRPLYTFRADRISGQIKGEGIKDVGTWHAVTVGKPLAPTPEPEPQPAPDPYPY